jgi:hypothetical protein
MTPTSQSLTHPISRVFALILLIVFAVSASASDERSSPPEVGDAYQETIDTAWEKAAAGNDPSMTCAALKGRIAGTRDQDAFPALFACNVDIPARYFHTYLDTVAAGEKTCVGLMREVMTKLSAMTMSADVIVEMAEKIEQGDDSESAMAGALRGAAGDAINDDGLKDPKRLVKDRIAERTRKLCPDFADTILR